MRNVGRVTFTVTGSSHMNYVIIFLPKIVSNVECVIYNSCFVHTYRMLVLCEH